MYYIYDNFCMKSFMVDVDVLAERVLSNDPQNDLIYNLLTPLCGDLLN